MSVEKIKEKIGGFWDDKRYVIMEGIRKTIGSLLVVISIFFLWHALNNDSHYIIKGSEITINFLLSLQHLAPIMLICSAGVVMGYILFLR